jgi:hypothetical protein
MNTYNSSKMLSQTLADNRYLKLIGGYMSGNLNIVGNENITSNLTTNYILYSSNSTSQVEGQIGYVYTYSGFSSQGSMGNSLHNVGAYFYLPVGVYVVSIQYNILNQAGIPITFDGIGLGFSIPNTTTLNPDIYEYISIPFTIPISGNETITRTWIYKNTTAGNIYLMTNYKWTIQLARNNYYFKAVRIA